MTLTPKIVARLAALDQAIEVLWDADANDWRELNSCADAIEELTLAFSQIDPTTPAEVAAPVYVLRTEFSNYQECITIHLTEEAARQSLIQCANDQALNDNGELFTTYKDAIRAFTDAGHSAEITGPLAVQS